MPLAAEAVNSHVKYADVFCSHCARRGIKRYAGAFVGKGQCGSCKGWLWVDTPPTAD